MNNTSGEAFGKKVYEGSAGVRPQLLADLSGDKLFARRFDLFAAESSSELANACRRVECEVFDEFFGNNAGYMAAQYGPYEDHSTFIGLLDTRQKQIAGCIRVWGGEKPEHFKGIHDVNQQYDEAHFTTDEAIGEFHPGFDSTRALEVGTLAVAKAYRGEKLGSFGIQLPIKVSTALYHAIYKYSQARGIEHWFGMIDTKPLSLVRANGFSFVPFAGLPAKPYMDSPDTQPAYLRLSEIAPDTRRIGLRQHLVICKGLGITATCRFRGSLR